MFPSQSVNQTRSSLTASTVSSPPLLGRGTILSRKEGSATSLSDIRLILAELVVFDNIVGGSWDCQLMVSWPDSVAGDMSVFSSSKHGSSATSSVSLDVYTASYNTSAYAALADPKGAKVGIPDIGPFATWDSMMAAIKIGNQLSVKGDNKDGQDKGVLAINAKLSYFGTVGVNPSEYGVTVNSEACPATGGKTLQFLFEIPTTDSRDASVSFSADKEKGAGVYLLANC